MDHQFSLDKSSKKFLCPACNKHRFVRYRDNNSHEFLADYVGRCDRESSCGYHFTPKQFFHENPLLMTKSWEEKCFKNLPIVEPNPQPDFINPKMVAQSLTLYQQNFFVQYLASLFRKEFAMELAHKFRIGTANRWNGATVFWQIDENLQIRSGKVMLYDTKTGKRKKSNGRSYIDWVHSILERKRQLKDFQLKQCLFGLHQLIEEKDNKTVAIVESEKTAILMTALMPDFIWMACGSASNLKAEYFQPLRNREIILYPDLGCFEKWLLKRDLLNSQGFQIQISDLLEQKASGSDRKQGLDLADFLIKRDHPTGFALSENNYPLFWDFSKQQ